MISVSPGPVIGVTGGRFWTDWVSCGWHVSGFKLRKDESGALNAIALKCWAGGGHSENTFSFRGIWDDEWTECPEGEIVEKFALRALIPNGNVSFMFI